MHSFIMASASHPMGFEALFYSNFKNIQISLLLKILGEENVLLCASNVLLYDEIMT